VSSGGGASDHAAIFIVFFSKKHSFLSIFWSKFLLKNAFLMTAKSVLMRGVDSLKDNSFYVLFEFDPLVLYR